MERPDSFLFGTVSGHDYTALSHEQNEQSSQTPEERPSQEQPSAHNHLLDDDDASENTARDTCVHDQTEQGRQDTEKPETQDTPKATLRRSGYILFLILIYIGLTASSWVITCYLSFRPITTNHYGVWYGNNNIYGSSASAIIPLYRKNEQWYRAARVIQSIASLLTIPLTSAVCSSAAVIFIQKRNRGLSMRQVITLADQGWTDIETCLRILPIFGTKGWKRYGSSFLLLAIFLNLLGSVISPLQQIFLSTSTIKTPTYPVTVSNLLDIPDQWKYANQTDADLIVMLTRNTLASTTNAQQQTLIWQGADVNCTITGQYTELKLPASCDTGGVTFGNMLELENPFLAQLPSGYGTGLIQQFIPRINSTAKYQSIDGSEFPQGCDQINGSFFVEYSNTTYVNVVEGLSTWGLQACMPANVSISPWKPTRDRQDFTEELYLNITLTKSVYPTESFYKITLNTTAGYFELPNYMNGEVAGPLLEKDPNNICGHACVTEGLQRDIYDHGKNLKQKRDGQSIDNDTLWPLESLVNKGPLLTIAMALFGTGSFIQDPHDYTSDPIGECVGLAPLGYLTSLSETSGQRVDQCIVSTNDYDVGADIINWLEIFEAEEDQLSNTFTSAAFLANQAWMENNIPTASMSLTINYDMGLDSQIPVISRAGLILISILLGLDFLILVPLAMYATFTPRWTSTLDAFTMMRLGAAVADKVPLLIGRRADKIDVLDEISGCVGDQSDENDVIGKLGLGAPRPLSSRKNKKFESYKGDAEKPDPEQERMKATMARLRAHEEARRNMQRQ